MTTLDEVSAGDSYTKLLLRPTAYCRIIHKSTHNLVSPLEGTSRTAIQNKVKFSIKLCSMIFTVFLSH